MSTPAADPEHTLLQAFVRLADTLVTDYDVMDLFHGLCADCVQFLGADAAGLLISDQRGSLQVVSASTEQAHLIELFQLQSDQGPCLDCFRTSAQVHAADLAAEARWPLFALRAAEQGFGAVHALPMRLRGQTIGALNLFHREPHAMRTNELGVGQALADVATIAILSDRSARERDLLDRAAPVRADEPGHRRAGEGCRRRASRYHGRRGVRRAPWLRPTHPHPAHRARPRHRRRQRGDRTADRAARLSRPVEESGV